MMTATRTFTHAYVRTQFMKLEVLGLVAGTINLPIVQKVVEYGITNKVLAWLEIYLHDSTTKRASITVTIDWKLHNILIKKSSGEITEQMLPMNGETTSRVLAQIIDLFKGYQRENRLSYWYNMGWIENGDKHDAAVGIARGGKTYLPIPSHLAANRHLYHEHLRELGIDVNLDAGEQ